jgi:predicted PurR-regulated permease PerM
MEILLTIVIVLFLTALYVIKNLLKKLEKYEEFVEKETQRNQALLEALREIDNRQMFEKDDEVGSIFYQIKETIERFKQLN